MGGLVQVGLGTILTVGLAALLFFVFWTVIRGFQLQFLELRFRRQVQVKDYAAALRTIEQALRISPGSAFLYHQRARLYAEMGDFYSAESDYTQGMRYGQGGTNLDGATAYAGRAATRLELGRLREALVDANHAIACSRLWWRAYYERGRVYAALGHYAIALEDFTQALDLNRFPPAELYLARAGVAAELGDEETARHDRQKAAELAPGPSKDSLKDAARI